MTDVTTSGNITSSAKDGQTLARIPYPAATVQFTAPDDSQLAAIVTGVDPKDASLVNLVIFSPTGFQFVFGVKQAPDNVPSSTMWNWPPRFLALNKGTVATIKEAVKGLDTQELRELAEDFAAVLGHREAIVDEGPAAVLGNAEA